MNTAKDAPYDPRLDLATRKNYIHTLHDEANARESYLRYAHLELNESQDTTERMTTELNEERAQTTELWNFSKPLLRLYNPFSVTLNERNERLRDE